MIGKIVVISDGPKETATDPTLDKPSLYKQCPECDGFGGFHGMIDDAGQSFTECLKCKGKGYLNYLLRHKERITMKKYLFSYAWSRPSQTGFASTYIDIDSEKLTKSIIEQALKNIREINGFGDLVILSVVKLDDE